MEEANTCGTGIAENAALPEKAGELIAALAGNLELHLGSLVADDANTRAERAACASLSTQHLAIADALARVARETAACRTLPMGEHDEQAFAAFERFVAAEEAMLKVLQGSLERDRAMLEAWRSGEGSQRISAASPRSARRAPLRPRAGAGGRTSAAAR